MVSSMRHWATASDVVEGEGERLRVTAFGRRIFASSRGFDPYMEYDATMWLVHLNLCGRPAKTTWYWFFQSFRRAGHSAATISFRRSSSWRPRGGGSGFPRRRSAATSNACSGPMPRRWRLPAACRRTALESPLSELGLVRTVGRRDDYQCVRGAKPTLPDGVFALCVAPLLGDGRQDAGRFRSRWLRTRRGPRAECFSSTKPHWPIASLVWRMRPRGSFDGRKQLGSGRSCADGRWSARISMR